ncbi:hypothetical protein [Aurantimonas sp. 22II-16-19i]|uniref:hypothetical protein n=1 Tax=Aurantimonas sp. 22II-16-19i TaxID=1317114 RepID=UPI0009F7D739|nr:hypothetical protein [Aurantimonas sp. 22II-16-19i]ORE90972.1 hypothetical protein ATO4_19959 [Aurantimonas sp. 22II-16-19i]
MSARFFVGLLAGIFVAGLVLEAAKAGLASRRGPTVTIIDIAELRAACGVGQPEAATGRVASGKTGRVVQ